MLKISVCSTKGGTGKSTLAVTLATYVASVGHKVCLIDLDAGQGSASAWARQRGTGTPELVPIKSLRVDLRRLATRGVDYVFIDSPPTLDDSGVVEAAVEVADYVLSPCRPSILDIGAAETIANLAGEIPPIGFVLMDVTDGKGWKGINTAAAKALADVGHVFDQHLTHRPSYVNNLAIGKTGPETDKVAAQEVSALWEEIAQWMK